MRRRSSRTADGDDIADFAELLSLCLASGLPAEQALGLAAGDQPAVGPAAPSETGARLVVRALAARLSSEDDVGPAAGPGGLLAAAWQLSRERGAPLTQVAQTCAGVLREIAASKRRENAAAAGPRSSMMLLTVLPLVGPAATLLVGVDVRATFANPVAVTSVGIGLLLTVVGWLWSRSLLSRARRPTDQG